MGLWGSRGSTVVRMGPAQGNVPPFDREKGIPVCAPSVGEWANCSPIPPPEDPGGVWLHPSLLRGHSHGTNPKYQWGFFGGVFHRAPSNGTKSCWVQRAAISSGWG